MLVGDPSAVSCSFVLPVYRCAATIGATLDALTAFLVRSPEAWELVVVDDGSDDETARVVRNRAERRPEHPLRFVALSRNCGKGVAIRTGLAAARGDVAVFTDADLPYDLDAVGPIVDSVRHGAAAAIACRVLPESRYEMSPEFFSYLYTRHLMGRAFNRLCRAVTLPGIRDTQAGLKGFDLRFLRPLLPGMVLDGFSFDVELLRAIRDAGGAIVELPVAFRYDSEPSTVRFAIDSLRMARDLLRVRWRSLRGRYRAPRPARISVVADDFGLSAPVDEAIRECLREGLISGASILPGCPSSEEAAAWAAAHPELDWGLHLNLTEGRPLSDPARVSSLVDEHGRFLPLARFAARWLAGGIVLHEVATEWTAQIAWLDDRGVRLRRLDSHQHVHLLPRLFRRLAVPLAAARDLRLRTMSGAGSVSCTHPDLRGLILRWMSGLALGSASPTCRISRGTGTRLRREPSLAAVRRTIQALSGDDRIVELVVHPGCAPAAGSPPVVDRYGAARERELHLLRAPEVRALLGTLSTGPSGCRVPARTEACGTPPAAVAGVRT